MAWFKVDDKFHSHPKIKRVPRRIRRAAIGLWTIAGSWCADYETDGAVPEYMLEEFDAEPEEVAALVDAELWERTEDGVAFRNWGEFQPTRAQLDEKRAQTAERVQKFRQKKRQNRTEDPVTSDDGNAVTGALVTQVKRSPRTRPVPVPDPITNTPPTPSDQLDLLDAPEPRKRGGAFVYPDAFESFWAVWPKRRTDTAGKKAAHASWHRAVNGTAKKHPRTTVAELQAAVELYAADPNLPPENFIPNATTWLNNDRWENGPLPPRGGPGGGRPDPLSQGLATAARLRAAREAREQQTTPQHPQLTNRRTA